MTLFLSVAFHFISFQELLPTRRWKASLRTNSNPAAIDDDDFNEGECTFQPKLQWDLVQERRSAEPESETGEAGDKIAMTRSEREKLERDLKYEDMELKLCTFKPNTNWSKSN